MAADIHLCSFDDHYLFDCLPLRLDTIAQDSTALAGRSFALISALIDGQKVADTGLRLQYAAALLKTHQDVELAGILRQLQGTPMSAQERRGYEDIRVGYILRQADALREAGDLAAAYDTLAPLLAERPNHPDVVGVLARMYGDNGDHAQAMQLYHRLLEKDPRNLKLLLPAASAATATKDFAYAESAIQVALQLAPQDPEVLTAAGRLYRAKGEATKAGQYFAAAIEAENRQRAVLLGVAGQGASARNAAAPGGNPFRRTAALANWGGRTPFPTAVPMAAAPMAYAAPIAAQVFFGGL